MELGKVFVDSVIVGQRHRALDPSKVEALAESMKAVGLQQPVSVYREGETDVHLIAGLHRLEAAKSLGWEQVDASFVKLSPARREMWEIAENLFRVDLTKEQRDEHIRRYAELLERAEKEAAEKETQKPLQNERVSVGGRGKKGTVGKIADQTGLSQATVRRALFQPAPEQVQAAAIRREQDKSIEVMAAEAFAEWIAENTDLDVLPQIIAWLEGTKPRQVIDALHRITSGGAR